MHRPIFSVLAICLLAGIFGCTAGETPMSNAEPRGPKQAVAGSAIRSITGDLIVNYIQYETKSDSHQVSYGGEIKAKQVDYFQEYVLVHTDSEVLLWQIDMLKKLDVKRN